MGRRPRAAAQAAAASISTPIPKLPEPSDDDMPDAPEAASPLSDPQEDASQEQQSDADGEAEGDVNGEGEVEGEAGNDNDIAAPRTSEISTPPPVRPPFQRRRRLGRPPKNRPPEWDLEDSLIAERTPDSATPQKRRRGRPPMAGGRWAKLRGPSHVTQVPIDKAGNMMDVVDDEVALPEEPEGEMKVDKMGRLQDGREYRCRTFTISGKGDRLYMLSTEPARCIGFRDSYLFFQKHKQLYKIIIEESAKRDLIDRELIPHSYKGRAIGVVTARSVFREFGARIIVGGRKIIDDYKEKEARERGDVEGELADPNDRLPRPGEKYNQNQYVAWHGASSVYHSALPSAPQPVGKVADKKRKVVVTDVNWMLEHAKEASRFNSDLVALRRLNLDGVYDPHTNTMLHPQTTQPTHCRWERIDDSAGAAAAEARIPDAANQIGGDDDDDDDVDDDDEESSQVEADDTMFPSPSSLLTRNYVVIDTVFKSPPTSGLGIPGPDAISYELGQPGLDDVKDAVLASLPADCLEAFERARSAERQWKGSWRSETDDGARAKVRVDL
ncbi:MAG: hypothetical protein M1825_002255 [Sarcosagium campestre]|nr:MAG: hypothetical protein M1825_002255 [Sarcosagium campestre]